MDPAEPMNRVSSIPLKCFIDYSKSASQSEDAIFHLKTEAAHKNLRHLQVVDVPHEDVKLSQSWNFLDIPLSIDPDVNMSSVSFLFLSSQGLLPTT